MAIKWENIKVGVSPLTNSIYIGKTKKNGDMELWTDKSGDRTGEIIKCVMQHMLTKRDNGNAEYRIGKVVLSISVEE